MTLTQVLRDIRKKLAPAAGEFALPEAERILTFLTGCSRPELYLLKQKPLPAGVSGKVQRIIRRRLKHEPLAYILGSAYFYDREFTVTADVLIPRPDTEVLVEVVLEHETGESCGFLDLGTGSGCIAAILAEHRPAWKAAAGDISFAALKVAKKNCPGKVVLLCGDRLSAIRRPFDFIVANPPYIRSDVLPTLDRSVRDFEPRIALDGGQDGLDFYRYLAKHAPPLLKKRGRIYGEIGFDQGEAVPEIFKNAGWDEVTVTRDLGKRPRVVTVRRSSLR